MSSDIDISRSERLAFERILRLKEELRDSLVVLGHHYQRRQIIELSDFIGDSYALAACAARAASARHIVFCGVAFMAESAAVLCQPGQTVFHPNSLAGCPMAQMAEIEQVEAAFDEISRNAGSEVVPLVYMNSDADVKAFCGAHGGLVCTSSNADAAMRWALSRGRMVLFMPDEHLATNTADLLGLDQRARTLYDPGAVDGGADFELTAETRLVQWKGYCHVHTHFTPEQVEEARRAHPGCLVVVHPECPCEVTGLADRVGSTSAIVEAVADAPPGATIVVGTEVNLVNRLALEHSGSKTVVPLSRSLCPNMFRINLTNLAETLESLDAETFRVTVPDDVIRGARLALQRMLDLS